MRNFNYVGFQIKIRFWRIRLLFDFGDVENSLGVYNYVDTTTTCAEEKKNQSINDVNYFDCKLIYQV